MHTGWVAGRDRAAAIRDGRTESRGESATGTQEAATTAAGLAGSWAATVIIERSARLPPLLPTVAVEDPVYLSKPGEWSGKWEYRPRMTHANQKCDVDVARTFLEQ